MRHFSTIWLISLEKKRIASSWKCYQRCVFRQESLYWIVEVIGISLGGSLRCPCAVLFMCNLSFMKITCTWSLSSRTTNHGRSWRCYNYFQMLKSLLSGVLSLARQEGDYR